MKGILYTIAGTLCVCSFSLTAADNVAPAPVTTAQIVSGAPVPIVNGASTPEVTLPAQTSVKAEDEKKTSFFDQFKVSEQPSRTCQVAMEESLKNGTVEIDLSNTTDFVENGDSIFNSCYAKLKETNSFGTNSSNIYVNLSKTNVTPEFIAKWSAEFKKDKKTVLWNLSDNPNLNDSIIDSIADLSNVCSLNFANTGITDTGIAKLSSLIETAGLKTISMINLSGTKVTDQAISTLRDAFKKALAAWQAANPGKTYAIEGDGVVFNKPFIPQEFKVKPADISTTVTAAPVTAVPVTVDSDKHVSDILSDADKILASAESKTTATASPAIGVPAA